MQSCHVSCDSVRAWKSIKENNRNFSIRLDFRLKYFSQNLLINFLISSGAEIKTVTKPPAIFQGTLISVLNIYAEYCEKVCRSQWPRGLRRRSSAARLLRLWVRIPPGAWMFVCCECCVLSGRGLCDGFITRPEESYRLWRVVACNQETSKTRRLKPATGL